MPTERPTTQRAQTIPGGTRDEYAQRPPFERRLVGLLRRLTKRRAQRGLRLALGALGYLTRDSHTVLPALRAGDPAIRRILIVRVDLLGDTVLTTPALRALRRAYPAARIDLLVTSGSAPVLAGDPDVCRVLPYDPHVWRQPSAWLKPATWREARRFAREVRGTRYDLAISVSGDIGSIVTRLSGARRRVGYRGEAYPYFLTDPVPGSRYAIHQHETRYVLALAAAAGATVLPGDERPVLHVVPTARERMRARLATARSAFGASGPIVTLHGGARNGQAKRWPPAHLAALADRLTTSLGALVVLTGAPNERALAEEIEALATTPLLNLAGQTSIPELVALLAESDLLVTGDSGPMHIACAVATPVVALHGPTDPAISGPTAPDAIILRQALWCSPCYDASETAECRFGNPVCMKTLAPGVVFAAARRQLARHRKLDGNPEAGAEHAAFPQAQRRSEGDADTVATTTRS